MPRNDDWALPWRYCVASAPGWVIGSAGAWALFAWAGVTPLAAAAVFVVLVLVDVVRYPRMRRYYESEPAWSRMRGDRGIALTPLNPEGLAHVHGEIWRVRVRGSVLPCGACVRVEAVDGLTLMVHSDTSAHDRHDDFLAAGAAARLSRDVPGATGPDRTRG